jgi:REP element-mobilizing transposase RayT
MIDLEIAVVMPDHVHLIFWPKRNKSGLSYSIPEIMKSIKGASAHKVNTLLKRKGQLWQTESFDHVLRKDESLQEKIDYIRLHPLRRGLVDRPEDYKWLWERSVPVL